jgi:hypothetical protein
MEDVSVEREMMKPLGCDRAAPSCVVVVCSGGKLSDTRQDYGTNFGGLSLYFLEE